MLMEWQTPQTFLRPKLKAKVENFIFYRAINCARTGVPPALISGKLVSDLIKSKFLNNNYEAIIRRRIFKCSKIVTKTIVLRSRWQYICFARLGMRFIASMVCTFCRWNCGFISWLRQRDLINDFEKSITKELTKVCLNPILNPFQQTVKNIILLMTWFNLFEKHERFNQIRL
jgi:hypothetical protein